MSGRVLWYDGEYLPLPLAASEAGKSEEELLAHVREHRVRTLLFGEQLHVHADEIINPPSPFAHSVVNEAPIYSRPRPPRPLNVLNQRRDEQVEVYDTHHHDEDEVLVTLPDSVAGEELTLSEAASEDSHAFFAPLVLGVFLTILGSALLSGSYLATFHTKPNAAHIRQFTFEIYEGTRVLASEYKALSRSLAENMAAVFLSWNVPEKGTTNLNSVPNASLPLRQGLER